MKISLGGPKGAVAKGALKVSNLFGGESDEDEQPIPGRTSSRGPKAIQSVMEPTDSSLKETVEKLAQFVAQNGRKYIELTRERNAPNSILGFLHDTSSPTYKWFLSRVAAHEGSAPAQQPASASPAPARPSQPTGHTQGSDHTHPPPPPLQPSLPAEGPQADGHWQGRSRSRSPTARGWSNGHRDRDRGYDRERDKERVGGRSSRWGEGDSRSRSRSRSRGRSEGAHGRAGSTREGSAGPSGMSGGYRDKSREPDPVDEAEELQRQAAQRALAAGDSLAAMEMFAKIAAKKDKLAKLDESELEDLARKARPENHILNETSYDRRRVTAVFRDDGKRGHHMQDFIPPEELAKLMSKAGDKAAAEAVEAKTAIGSDNIGHKLLQKMGWKEGQGLGSSQAASAITAPVQASGVKQDKEGLGASTSSQAPEDPFEAYRMRMQLGYKHRPNPLGNPRKAYY